MKMGNMPGGSRGMGKSIQSIVWMIGMAYCFATGNWWPGMMYVMIASAIANIVVKLVFASTMQESDEFDPDVFDAPMPENDETLTPDPVPSSNNTRMQRLDPEPIPPAKNLSREYRTDLLPPNCPNCGAPIGVNDVEMVGIKTAKCGFCGSNISLSK